MVDSTELLQVFCEPGTIPGMQLNFNTGEILFIDYAEQASILEYPDIRAWTIDYAVDEAKGGRVSARSGVLQFYGNIVITPEIVTGRKYLCIEGYPRWSNDVAPCYTGYNAWDEYFKARHTLSPGKSFYSSLKLGASYIEQVIEKPLTNSQIVKITNNYQKINFGNCETLTFLPPWGKYKVEFRLSTGGTDTRYFDTLPIFNLGCREPEGCPENTCEVICGNTVCCYNSDGESVESFPLVVTNLKNVNL